jgi:hypothetical protein
LLELQQVSIKDADSMIETLYLATQNIRKKCAQPLQNWGFYDSPSYPLNLVVDSD